MDYFKNIENYLFNRLSPEDKLLFEKEAKHNEALAKELEIQRFEIETINQIDEDDLRENLKGLGTEATKLKDEPVRPVEKTAIRRSLIFKGLAIAASVLVLIGFLFIPQLTSTSNSLVASSYESAKLNFGDSGTRTDDAIKSIFEAPYIEILKTRNKTKSKEAINYFKNYTASSETNAFLALQNLGHAYLLDESNSNAIETFNSLLENERVGKRLKEEASFFRALAFYQNQEELKSKMLFQNIVESKGRFSVLAKKILDEID